ncbi:M10 family metallopeptidase [Nitrosomonas sp.]|uniref:M10 family metallopeptidase n=1 Tax=Nitrosomonas sp. TaxID=42353 RepID=UPI001D57C222|nr:M10 family metallopeptidase [Nitrosomonas sp.]MBX3616361.1 M10 family metallopeptidase [Nitrosomonas sp.]
MPSPLFSSSTTNRNPSGINSIDALLNGSLWLSSTISFSFPTSNSTSLWSTYSNGYGPVSGDGEPWRSTFSPLSSTDQSNFIHALQQWANVIKLNFTQVGESPGNVGDIRAAYTVEADSLVLAWTYLPSGSPLGGDIWINTKGELNKEEWNPGSLSFETILHELGHALGLKHPFTDPDNPSEATLPPDLDNTIHTVMSYTYANLDGDEGNGFSFHPTTPMVLDIAAIQYLYGPNNNYHTGNDTYVYDDAHTYHETIWDAGGASDTIQYTGSIPSLIDLNATHPSLIGQAVYVQANGVNLGSPIPNVWIADKVTIENAIGGQGDDILVGNSSRNSLDGGAGIDTVRIETQYNQATLSKNTSGYTVKLNTDPSNEDTLVNIERAIFDDYHLALDLDGNAGEVAKLIGAVFGATFVNNTGYVGIGLSKTDEGLSYEQLAKFAIDATRLTDHDKIVTLLWHNLFGELPTDSEKSPYVEMLDDGDLSIGGLTVLAAESVINAENINLTGLVQTGLPYIEVG